MKVDRETSLQIRIHPKNNQQDYTIVEMVTPIPDQALVQFKDISDKNMKKKKEI